MYKKHKLLLALLVFGFWNSMANSPTQDYAANELIASLKPNTSQENFNTTFQGKIVLKECLYKRFNIWLLSVNNIEISTAIEWVNSSGLVNKVQKNHLIHYRCDSLIPNDTLYYKQWSMDRIGMPLVWCNLPNGLNSDGDTLVVAVIDNGISPTHPDLQENIWINRKEIPYNNIDDDNNGYIDDYFGWNTFDDNDSIDDPFYRGRHGTPVTGIIGSKGNNQIGIAGINWHTKLMIVVGGGNEANALKSYGYILEQKILYLTTNGAKGAMVVATNASWGVNNGKPSDAPLWCELYDSLGKYGILNAAATANNNINVDLQGDLPSTCPSNHLIAVTNVNFSDSKHGNAAYGPINIDIGAPGEGSYTTAALPDTVFYGKYRSFGGTSGSSPFVAGAIAMLHQIACQRFTDLYKTNPIEANLLLKSFLLKGVDTLPSLLGETVSGGRLNVYKASLLLNDWCDTTPDTIIPIPPIAAISVFPNPFNKTITIELPDNLKGAGVAVFDITGRKINYNTISTNNVVKLENIYATGLLILQILESGSQKPIATYKLLSLP